MDRRHHGLDFARRTRIMRTLGLSLTALSYGSVFYEQGASVFHWLLLLIWGLAWPQLAYSISIRTAKPQNTEKWNMLVDACVAGAWVPLLAFNLVPALVNNVYLWMSIWAAIGPRRLAWALLGALMGGVVSTLVVGFNFQPASSTLNIIATIPVLLFYGLGIGMMSYDINKKFLSKSRELADEVSRREVAQAAAQQARQEAEHAGRAKTEFLSRMSHELRTPLNAVIGFSDAMAVGITGELSEMQAGYVQDISNSGQHLLSLINDILDLSKVESGKATIDEEEVDVREAVQSALPFVREQAREAGIELFLDLPSQISLLRADSRKVKQMLVNLLSNAVKFTPPDGRVTVSVAEGNKPGMVISVIDTGVGISFEDIPKALLPYEQIETHQKNQGTGLGLPLVKAMAELHGGELNVESEIGIGTTVAITFPAERIVGQGRIPVRLLAQPV